MVARGHVHNGVVVLHDGVCLPEGQEVTVLAAEMILGQPAPVAPHSVLDVQCVSLGSVLHPPGGDDDLLAEMLEGRQ